ncbi:hypothetical protein ACJX0J_039747 [Zea mays]
MKNIEKLHEEESIEQKAEGTFPFLSLLDFFTIIEVEHTEAEAETEDKAVDDVVFKICEQQTIVFIVIVLHVILRVFLPSPLGSLGPVIEDNVEVSLQNVFVWILGALEQSFAELSPYEDMRFLRMFFIFVLSLWIIDATHTCPVVDDIIMKGMLTFWQMI